RRAGRGAYAGVRAALVTGRWTDVSGDPPAAVEFRAAGWGSRGRRLPRRALRGDGARADDHSRYQRDRRGGGPRAAAPRRLVLPRRGPGPAHLEAHPVDHAILLVHEAEDVAAPRRTPDDGSVRGAQIVAVEDEAQRPARVARLEQEPLAPRGNVGIQ